jgi:hypothetical protein
MGLEELSTRISNFYLNPTFEAFQSIESAANAHAKELADKKNGADHLFSVFLFRAAEKHKWTLSDPGAISRAAADLKEGSSHAARFVRDDTNVTPTKLDVWWISYFATGETGYLEKLMQYAGRELPQNDVKKALIIGAATWSFKSNCKQHDSIRKFAEACLADDRYKDRRLFLRGCIDYAAEGKRLGNAAAPATSAGNPATGPSCAPLQAAPAKSEPPSWHQDGGPVANTDSRKSVDGFGAALLVTSDADWEKKWNTPSSETPHFAQIDRLKLGERAWILIFFANPKPDAGGSVDITCDIKITRPNGKITENTGLEALKTQLKGAPTNTFLAKPVIGFVGEDSDPLGDWIVEVAVHDLNRSVSVPLKTMFTLLGPADTSPRN